MIVPVHNEAGILDHALSSMLTEFRELGVPFEIVVCENGSIDDSFATLEAYQRRHPEIRVEQLAKPDYGAALRHSVSVCSFPYVAMVNVDFWTLDFLRTAVRELATHDVVIGSKIMTGARDRRPLLRRAITRSFNAFLAICFGFRGSDTHGMKAMRTAAIAPILPACTSQGWIFDTEMVIRAERAKLRILEVPVHTRELRAPGYWALITRVPGVISNLYRMSKSLRSGAK